MNTTSKLVGIGLAVCLVGGAVASDSVTVSTVAALQSALAAAESGDEIIISSSGSPYDLSTADCMSRAGHLLADETVTLRGSTGNPADVVLVGSTNRILYLAQAGNTIRDITFKNGTCTNNADNTADEPRDLKRGGAICLRQWQDLSTISNCVFAGNTAKYGGAVGNYFSTRTDDVSWGGLFFDCVFTNNASFSHGGAAFNAGLMRKCKFIGNHLLANFNSSYGAAVYQAHLLDGCDFVENGSTEQRYGAVYNYGTYETTNLTIRNCKFIRNIAYTGGAAIGSGSLGDGCCNTIVKGCLFESNSLAYDWANGGAVSLMTNIWDCTFVGNSSSRCGAAYQSTLYGCTFISNRSIRTDVAGALRECKAYNCTFTGNFAYQGAAAYMSSLVGCVISNNDTVAHNQTGRVLEHCMVDSCRIQDETSDGVIFAGRCYVTNTLVTGCEGNGYTFLVGHNASCTQTLVNCTIVSNNFTRFVNWYNNTGDVHVVNSLFFGNTVGGNAYDFDSSATNCLKSITNSVFAVSSASCLPDGALDAGAGNYNYAGTAFNPKFAGERVDPKNPFALRRGSPCVKTYHGLVQDWMAAATDIRGDGFPRLRDGRVDIGCYQCWEVVPGLVITVR